MCWKHVIALFDVLDDPAATGERVLETFKLFEASDISTSLTTIEGARGRVDFVHILIPGKRGRTLGGDAPTLGIIGRLGGIGARPERIGFTSDGDGALAALSAARKLAEMHVRGDVLEGDVIITTQICPTAPTRPHEPVPFMDSPVPSAVSNEHEVDPVMDAILTIDTTKGNRILNARGVAVTPTVRDGWILRVCEPALDILSTVTGRLPLVLPVTMQDITPYGNDVYHLNSILQPSVATRAPVIGVAITTVSQVAGCATGASHLTDVEEAARFAVETAKAYTAGRCPFNDETEYRRILELYGSMAHLRTMGEKA